MIGKRIYSVIVFSDILFVVSVIRLMFTLHCLGIFKVWLKFWFWFYFVWLVRISESECSRVCAVRIDAFLEKWDQDAFKISAVFLTAGVEKKEQKTFALCTLFFLRLSIFHGPVRYILNNGVVALERILDDRYEHETVTHCQEGHLIWLHLFSWTRSCEYTTASAPTLIFEITVAFVVSNFFSFLLLSF